MNVIYSPKGRAGEYGELACNIYLRCEHKCLYCYCPQALRITREEFFKAPVPRLNFNEKLEADVRALNKKDIKENIFLSFIGDPYQPIEDKYQITSNAIHILHASGFNINILTKGGKRAVKDFPLYREGDVFATTLTFYDHKKSLEWEPGAASPADRVETLKEAHAQGIKTWVSLEPVIEPEETLELIRLTYEFVDLFKVGKLNYHPLEKKTDWSKFAKDAVALLTELEKPYYIKNDLRGYL